jgi:hypothetical protein
MGSWGTYGGAAGGSGSGSGLLKYLTAEVRLEKLSVLLGLVT